MRGYLYGGSFALLVSDHSALALDRLVNAVVSQDSGKEKTRMNSAFLESDVR